MRLSRRDLSKFAQTKEQLDNIGSTTVKIEPSNKYVTEAVDMLQRDKPDVLHNITDIRTDLDKDVFGEYVSDSPHTVFVNISKIEGEVRSRMKNASPEDIEQEIKEQTAIVISHESGHQHAYTTQNKNTSEAPAEQAEEVARQAIRQKEKV